MSWGGSGQGNLICCAYAVVAFLQPKQADHGEPAVVLLERRFALRAVLFDAAEIAGVRGMGDEPEQKENGRKLSHRSKN